MRQYRGINYSVQKLPEGLYLLIDLGGPFKNKMFRLSANNDKEIQELIDKELDKNGDRILQRSPQQL